MSEEASVMMDDQGDTGSPLPDSGSCLRDGLVPAQVFPQVWFRYSGVLLSIQCLMSSRSHEMCLKMLQISAGCF